MATSGQEQIYNKITRYNDYIDNLNKLIQLLRQQNQSSRIIEALEDFNMELELFANSLADFYINFVRFGGDKDSKQVVLDMFERMDKKNEKCAKILFGVIGQT